MHAAFAIDDCGVYVCACARFSAKYMLCVCVCVCSLPLASVNIVCACARALSLPSLPLSKYGVGVCVRASLSKYCARALSLILCALSSSSTNSEHDGKAVRIKLTANRQTGQMGSGPTHWRSASVGGKGEDLLPAQRS